MRKYEGEREGDYYLKVPHRLDTGETRYDVVGGTCTSVLSQNHLLRRRSNKSPRNVMIKLTVVVVTVGVFNYIEKD